MPRPARLEPYRELIQEAIEAGKPAPLIRKQLEVEHNVTVPDSTWSDTLQRFAPADRQDKADMQKHAPVPTLQAGAPLPIDILTALLKATAEELTDSFTQVTEELQQLKTETHARYGEVRAFLDTIEPARITDTLSRHTDAFEAMLARLEATARWRARLRMALSMGLFTGTCWGVGLWYMLRSGLPW